MTTFGKLKIFIYLMLVLLSSIFLNAQTISSNKVSDGGIIAYCYQNPTGNPQLQIYSVNTDGTNNKQMISASIGLNHEDWSPDGKNIVAVGYMDASFTTWSLHTFSANGTNLRRITSVSGVADTEPAWSPDGSKIAFTRIFWSPDGQFENSRKELWVINVDGSGSQYIGIEGYVPKWSPDGTKFIYSSKKSGNYEIYTCLVNGTNEQRLTNTSAHETYPIWSPDGNKIAFCSSTGVFNSPEAQSTYELYVMSADGTNMMKLTNNSCLDSNPRWSLDGSSLAFVSDRSANGHYEVYIMNNDGTNVQRVTNSPGQATAINPAWRPVGATDVQKGDNNIPNDFKLFQNYPNPFNPSTTISYELPIESNTKLEVYDMLGNKIRMLVDDVKAAGRHSATWNGSDFSGKKVSSGIYFIKLNTSNSTQVCKALLMK